MGSDERSQLTDFVRQELEARGLEIEAHGAVAGEPLAWPDVAERVAQRVASGACQQGILFCWTGTGVSIAANKVAGIRAALCPDAETARGARLWNDANVLVLSLRFTSQAVAREILEAWLATAPDPGEAANIAKLAALEGKYLPRPVRKGG